MTTTVRILGSRAREQVPGTSITLLAPGFRGALTKFAAGVASTATYDLPFTEAAAGAEVMLAAQLTLSLEARVVMEGPGLRSRSAVVTHPRVIVPRRTGLAYVLLQTDETGASSFVWPASHDETEAIFPLTIAAHGATRRVLRVLMWPNQQVSGLGALAAASRWERLRRPHQLAQCAGRASWRLPDWKALEAGPVLLLLHDTFSTPQATFADWVGDESFARVLAAYGGRCLAFSHPTVASGIDENLAWLATHLATLPGPLDIVAHGRGGLLARAIAADGRLPLHRICQIGTPNKGTALAASLPRFLDGHVAMLARSSKAVAQATLEGALCMTRFAALEVLAPLPGMEVLQPNRQPAGAIESPARQWFTVSAQFTNAAGHDTPDDFSDTPNDLVVPADACHQPGAPVADSLRLGGAEVHHHNYFTDRHVRERLESWLPRSL
ncbi:MAG: hypothetical protein ABI769_16495 [Pseudomonadota bacterium]